MHRQLALLTAMMYCTKECVCVENAASAVGEHDRVEALLRVQQAEEVGT